MFVLRTSTGKFYTGRAGEGWLSSNAADAFRMGEGQAERVGKTFNSRSTLHGETFAVEVA